MAKSKLFLKVKLLAWRVSEEEHAMAEKAAIIESRRELRDVSVSEIHRRHMIQVFEKIINSEAA